jgi:hypothetical protein
MKRIITKIILTFVISLFALPNFVSADGGLFPPPDYFAYETGQKAAIYFEKDHEILVIQSSFSGNAKDFAYIIPTPKQPTITKISDDIFKNLETMTRVENETIRSYAVPTLGNAAMDESKSVTVLESKQVGVYEIKVISATDANALFNWLKDNNFTYPENKKYILDDYIAGGWFFTTAKISASAIDQDTTSKLMQGALTPLKLEFDTNNMVYPMKISAVTNVQNDKILPMPMTPTDPSIDSSSTKTAVGYNYAYYQSVPITLYIFSDHKKDIPNFETDYANWIKSSDIEKLAKDDNGNSWIKNPKKMYLTKLYRYMSIKNMGNDIFPDNAKNNTKVGVKTFWQSAFDFTESVSYFIIWSVFLVIFIIAALINIKPEKRINKFWIIQLISWIMIFLLPIISLILSISYLNQKNYYSYDFHYVVIEMFISVIVFAITTFVITIIEKPKKT